MLADERRQVAGQPRRVHPRAEAAANSRSVTMDVDHAAGRWQAASRSLSSVASAVEFWQCSAVSALDGDLDRLKTGALPDGGP